MSNSHVRVLIVFANPRGTSPLQLGTEDRAIRESIKLSRYRDNISLQTCHASTIHDLRRALLDHEYQIIHISGHGTDTGLMLEDELGGNSVVPQQALADLFQVYSPPLKCVILNACYSLSQGQLTSLGVPFTVAMEGPISDNAAIEFSRGFYDAIGAGRDIEFAYEEGCRTASLAAPDAHFLSNIFKDTQQSDAGSMITPISPLAIVEWKVSMMGSSYALTARLANSSHDEIAIVKNAFIRVHDFREHSIKDFEPYCGAPIHEIKVARLQLPLERKGGYVPLSPNRRFSFGEIEDLVINIIPREGYQHIFSFGFHWHCIGDENLRELEAGYVQVGHAGSTRPTPPPRRNYHKPMVGNPNLDDPIILKVPQWLQ